MYRKSPSFSSSLLEAIYHSISEGEEQRGTTMLSSREKFNSLREFGHGSSLGRAIMIEKWIEKQGGKSQSSMHAKSSSVSNSSESSSGCMFSSSEEQSEKSKSRKFSNFKTRRQNPVGFDDYKHFEWEKEKPKREGSGFTKTKLRALKIYGELKKVKQPISPGGKISSFINSIFNSTNAKKAKMCHVGAVEDVTLECKSKSACSSASSFSRSCLSKAPNSRGKLSSNGGTTKRSVRFYPVCVIVDEDCKPCGHKSIYDQEAPSSMVPSVNVQKIVRSYSLREELQNYIMQKQSYHQKKTANEFGFLNNADDLDNEDDADSYASSDLFELDSLIGIGKYTEDLPVYETTNLKTNQAIANGLIS